jgi:eukaryotic-like serine/threonine-protein kinase
VSVSKRSRVFYEDIDMSAGTEPARWSEPRAGSQGATLAWLDALSSGACTPEAFLSAMRDQFQGDSEEGWEILSLLDQYYRRGKIKAELFQTLKTRLESSALMVDEDMAARQRSTASGQRKVTPVARPPVRDAPAGAIREAAAAASREAASGVAREVAVGDVLRNRYRVRAVIGHGGMGTVFEATDEYRLALAAAGQRLALKVLHTAVTRREEVLIELQREFQHLQLLSHPNIVRVHEFDRDGDVAFFTMELLNGAPLSGVLSVRNATALPRPYAFAIMRDVGAAISYAHSHGVVHGDINPQNIFVTNDGDLRVLDFGASNKLLRDRWLPDNESADPGPVATPGYASCQLLEGQKPDARDDLFAFACVAYVLLSGRHPFPNRTALEARAQRLRPRRPPGLGGPQWRVLREGLRWERDRRPSDVQKWLRRFNLAGAAARLPALPVLVNAPPPRGPHGLLATAAVTLLALLVAGGMWAMMDYESFQSHVAGWRGGMRSALETATTTPPRASQPAATAPAPLAREAIPAPSRGARDAAAPPPVSRAAPVPRAAPIAAPPPASASAHTAAPARVVPGEAVARAANAGPMRIEMAADTVDIQPGETTANVVVHRKGNLHGETSFTWWTESGTAQPGRDFAAAVPRVEHFEDGSKSVILNIPVSASPRSQPRSFYVVIDRTDTGAALGEHNLTMVTLQPDG